MKKLLSCLLVISLMLMPNFSASAAEPNMELMISLGIFPTDYSDSDAFATRAEFISAAVKLFGYSDAAMSCTEQMFYDVTTQNTAYYDINFAASQGYISGTAAGYFSPAAPITDVQAVKVLISMLGYDMVAQKKGGYPVGYLITADQLDLFAGIDYPKGDAISLGNLAIMFKNCLNVCMVSGYSSGGNDYFETEEQPLLSRYNLKMAEGVLESAGTYSILPDENIDNDQIRINGKVYYGVSGDVSSLLGKAVEIYYDDTNSGATLVSIAEDEKKNEIISFNSDDVTVSALAGGSIKYTENNKAKTVKLSSGLKVVYNGRGLSSYTSSDIYMDGAVITLLDNNRDNSFDVMFVQNSVVFRVSSANASAEKIYMENVNISGNRALDLSEAETVVIKGSDEDTLTLEDIDKGQWISAAVSRDSEVISLTVLDSSITGVVETITDDEPVTLTINGTDYQIRRDASGEAISRDEFKLGNEYTFILDEFGRLCRIDDSIAQLKQYGYIVNKGVKSGISQLVQVRLLKGTTVSSVKQTETNYIMQGGDDQELLILDFADKIKFNGSRVSSSDIYASIPEGSVVEYALNTAGEIRSIETVTQYYNTGERIANCKSKVFGGVTAGAFGIDDETVVFFVPVSGEEEDYYANMQITDGKKYITSSYGFDTEDYTADACVINLNVEIDSLIDFNDSTPIFAVQSVRGVMNEEGEWVHKVCGYLNGEWKELLTRSDKAGLDEKISQLTSGDLIYYSTDNLGAINGVKRIATFNLADAPYHTGVSGITENIWGTITNTRSKVLDLYSQDYTNNIDISVGNEQITVKSAVLDGAVCYRFDYSTGNYEPVEFSELPLYQSGNERVFVYMRSSKAKVIVSVE